MMTRRRRTIAISDIHGCLDEFLQLLGAVSYRPGEDRLILLGDYVDRGPKSREVLDEIIRLKEEGEVEVLLGNHDHRFVEVVTDPDSPLVERFFQHGGYETLVSYWGVDRRDEPFDRSKFRHACAMIRESFGHQLDLLREAALFVEDEGHVYVHAGLHPDYADWRNQPEHLFFTVREPFLNEPPDIGRVIVFGHTQVHKLHDSSDIWFGGSVIGIDGGCSAGRQLNALIIEEGMRYRSTAVQALTVS